MTDVYYPALIAANDSGFGVTFPDFPGCVAAGSTMHEAALASEAALAAHIENLLKGEENLPEPSSLDEINATIGKAGHVACVLIRTNMPVEQVLISLDAGLLRSIDAVAFDRSAWIAQMSRAELARTPSALPASTLTYQRIEALVRKQPGLSESEIARELFGSKGYQQKVNPDCRWLVQSGRLVRSATRPARYYLSNAIPEGVDLRAAASRRPTAVDAASLPAND